ncbi:hypothetical protein HPC49_10415 [Pyxidicoccus fallax]|uniref:PEGA domain-containing protein n=1 Tax=Pyxidicoccus fallax TaxID=394095 RepID=A0A848LJ02_9BACT|nr:hypothetical protein [Pyxidicoccus fallax]NMO17656.1 hypothetical protein [Pyxidicoccus fallax]NPC78656.1 hypothetical protein [Pyxidicoccus fallax]
MLVRGCLLSLALLLSSPALAEDGVTPDAAQATNKRIAVARGSTPPPGPPKRAEVVACTTPAQRVSMGERSVVIVRCPEDCIARLDGRGGLRRDDRTWEFTHVEPGRRHVEASGGLLNRRLFRGRVDIPPGTKATVYGDSKGNVKLTRHRSLGAAKKTREETDSQQASHLNVRCQKSCTVSLDGTRRGASGTTSVLLTDVKPGTHELGVVFTVGKSHRRATLDVPARSEMFITVSESGGVQVTNTKALASTP